MKVKGIYDGTKVVLLEPVSLSPNTPVEVLIPEYNYADNQLNEVARTVELQVENPNTHK